MKVLAQAATSRVHPSNGAFTLVELLLVVMILAILAAVVVPQFGDNIADSEVSLLQANVVAIQGRVDFHKARTGSYPTAIDPNWFSTKDLPSHPHNTFGVPRVQTLPHATASHPFFKVLKNGMPGAYWYNPALGVVRVRVADQGSLAKTLDDYNRVNQSNETSLGNYGAGGGGGS